VIVFNSKEENAMKPLSVVIDYLKTRLVTISETLYIPNISQELDNVDFGLCELVGVY
jgi:hypothetical protein